MIEYKFNWAGAGSDPRETIRSMNLEPLINERSGSYIQKWRIQIAGSEPNQAVIDALNATGNIVGSITTSVVA